MAKRNAPPAPPDEPDALSLAVDRLAQELTCLRQVLEEVREDFSWVTRNGVPVQPIEHVHVRKMAVDPCADDWGERLEIESSTFGGKGSASPLDSVALDQIADDLKTTFEAVAQGQLEIVLSALDGVRGEILTTLKRRSGVTAGESVRAAKPSSTPPYSPTPDDASAEPPPGRLF